MLISWRLSGPRLHERARAAVVAFGALNLLSGRTRRRWRTGKNFETQLLPEDILFTTPYSFKRSKQFYVV